MIGWTILRRVPFSSARKWSGATFDGHGTWLLGAPSIIAGGRLPDDVAAEAVVVLAAVAALTLWRRVSSRTAGRRRPRRS